MSKVSQALLLQSVESINPASPNMSKVSQALLLQNGTLPAPYPTRKSPKMGEALSRPVSMVEAMLDIDIPMRHPCFAPFEDMLSPPGLYGSNANLQIMTSV